MKCGMLHFFRIFLDSIALNIQLRALYYDELEFHY